MVWEKDRAAIDQVGARSWAQVIFSRLARLVEALADPARRERTVLIVLAAYALIWTLYAILAKASQDVHPDAAELVAWSRHLALGYTKHPPLAGWVVRAWFSVFPTHDWSYYLLAIAYATAGLWVAWHLFGRLLDPDKRIVALACLTLVPYFNFHGIRFDHNAVLGILWAATTLCGIRSFDTRSPLWSALAGAAAGAAMLGKYWSIFLLAGLVIAALTDTRRASYFRSAAPWITVGVGMLVLAPHLFWLVQNDFVPFSYALGAHNAHGTVDNLVTVARYVFGGIGYSAVPALVVIVLTRPGVAAFVDMLLPAEPERRFMAVTFWVTFLLPVAFGLLLDLRMHPLWTMPDLILLPVVLLSSPLLTVSRKRLAAMVAFVVALPLVMLAAAPSIALAIHIAGPNPVSAHARLLAERVDQEWRRVTDRPLQVVGGDFGLANATAFYGREKPSALPVLEPETVPWVTPEFIAHNGAAMVCELYPGQHDCTLVLKRAIDAAIIANPPPQRVELTLVRRFWGIAGEPQRYLIMIAPPR